MNALRPQLAKRATELLASERAPKVPPPAPEERARAIAALARVIAEEASARRRRRLLTAALSAAAAFVLLSAGLVVRRSSAGSAEVGRDQGVSLPVVAQGAAQMYQLGRVFAERGL